LERPPSGGLSFTFRDPPPRSAIVAQARLPAPPSVSSRTTGFWHVSFAHGSSRAGKGSGALRRDLSLRAISAAWPSKATSTGRKAVQRWGGLTGRAAPPVVATCAQVFAPDLRLRQAKVAVKPKGEVPGPSLCTNGNSVDLRWQPGQERRKGAIKEMPGQRYHASG
jgi:hypothetical protein